MWDNNNGIVAGTTSTTPSPFHTWNIGGAWDHLFSPNLVLEVRGGFQLSSRSCESIEPQRLHSRDTSRLFKPRRDSRFFLNVGNYIGSANSGIGNVGPQHRENPEHNFNSTMTWIHGKHTVRFGGEYLYENRLEINTYETFRLEHCPDLSDQRLRPLRLRRESGQRTGLDAARSAFGLDGQRPEV